MNVRALTASGQLGTSKPNLTQADVGRARASWASKKTTVSFSSTRQELEPLPVEAAATPKAPEDLLRGKPEAVKSIIGVKVTSPSARGGSAGNLIGGSGGTGPAFDESDAIDQTLLEERLQSGAWEKLPHWKCALVELYKKLGGPGWRERGGWPSAEHVPTGSVPFDEELFGVSRAFDKRHEVSILDLAWNNLAGDMSTVASLWGMSGLEVLSLGANKLTGVLPGLELKKLPRLRELHLYRNSLRGSVSPELGSLRHLTSLWLFENHLTGPLPDELGQLGELVDLKLNSNRLTGPIPPAIAYCTNLKTLNLQKNCFTGVLPDALFTSCGRLRDLRLWGNSFTGPLSPEVGCLHHLEVLMAQHNQLSWVVPPAIGRCEKLTALDLSHNDFRGDLPSHAFGTLSSLTSLSVGNNVRICGEIPREFRQLKHIKTIDLSGSSLKDMDEFAADVANGKTAAPPGTRVIIEGYNTQHV